LGFQVRELLGGSDDLDARDVVDGQGVPFEPDRALPEIAGHLLLGDNKLVGHLRGWGEEVLQRDAPIPGTRGCHGLRPGLYNVEDPARQPSIHLLGDPARALQAVHAADAAGGIET